MRYKKKKTEKIKEKKNPFLCFTCLQRVVNVKVKKKCQNVIDKQ